MESCNIIKDGDGILVMGEDNVRKMRYYFENLCNMVTQEKVAIHMCGFDVMLRGNYFR